MKFDTLPPFFLYTFKEDTLVRAHFRGGFETGRFNKNGTDPSIRRVNNKLMEDYELKGIYGYSFAFNKTKYPATLENLQKRFGHAPTEKVSADHRVPFHHWSIGPCHHLLLFLKKPFSLRHGIAPDREYTYVLFVYNLSDKEISDVVETEGAIRNE